jgi:hypothetical protein
MEDVMKFFHTSLRSTSLKAVLLGCVAAAAVAMPVGAHAGVNDPLQIIYVFPGAVDNGGANSSGVATSVHCTNIGPTTENLQYVALGFDGAPRVNGTLTVPSGNTRTGSTKATNLYSDDLLLNFNGPVVLQQGVFVILATSINFHCTAMIVDAAASAPNGINLQALRFNPIPGTQ